MIPALAIGGLLLVVLGRRELPAWLMETGTGIDNRPDDDRDARNLAWMESMVIPRLLAMVRSVHPEYVITSVYRSDAVNEAVNGSNTSWHRYGLAVDISLPRRIPQDERDAAHIRSAQLIRELQGTLPQRPAEVIAETWRNHVHVGMFPPHRKPWRATKYRHWAGENDWRALPV